MDMKQGVRQLVR